MTSQLQELAPLHRGADALVYGVMGAWRRRGATVREWRKHAERVEELSSQYEVLAEADLVERVKLCRERCARKARHLDEGLLVETMAALREAAARQLGLRAYGVQIMGVLALNEGGLAEMATGEGKTLVAALAAVLNAFRRRPCHVITVNDYLVTRDAKRMSKFFEFCGLSSGAVVASMPPTERRKVYRGDITYVTSKEVLADFLRDQIACNRESPSERLGKTKRQRVLERGLLSAIVDEADSVLIDEAVTPLIISQTRENVSLSESSQRGATLADQFVEGEDYEVKASRREITLTKVGQRKLDDLGEDLGGLWKAPQRRWELLRSALVAITFYEKDKQYLIKDGKVVIVDEFTGRPMPQRTWRQGLHQAIEAKEGLEITAPSETVARMSFQRFFRSYRYLSGMTGTAREAASEFWHIYQRPVVRIPVNRPCQRCTVPVRAFRDRDEKWNAVVESICEIHETGRPILVGTRNVEASEQLSQRLLEVGLVCQVLNAARLAEEALVIAKAGEAGKITIATNMAGRGTDIVIDRDVVDKGGLHVMATEAHESSRIDRQLFGRAGRQGDPGSSQLFFSLEDELVQNHLSVRERQWLPMGKALRKAQTRAQRQAYQKRRRVLQMDDWLDNALSFASS
ncbi:MAG: hypothetical protein L7V86_12040 [Verrucomicrobiales bacterium]|nr:hypothetical protein [Verrucomicrobiales bacterium]